MAGPIVDYASLKTTVADYLHRSDLSDSVLSGFVQLAETRLNRKLRLLEMETIGAALSLVSATQAVALPTGWLATIDLYYDSDKREIKAQSLKNLNSQRTFDATTGRPYLYAVSGGNLIFEIIADQTYALEMDYYKGWDVETDDTNWLLQTAPDAYLYGSLIEAKAYTKSKDDMSTWILGLSTAIDDLNNLDNRSRNNATLRTDTPGNGRRFDIQRGF